MRKLSKRLRRIFRVSGKQSQIVFDRGAPQGGLSCPFGAIHLLYVGENTSQAASVEFVRHKRGPHKARMRFMGRGEAQSQMEFSATREMKYCDWSIDDMRAADCKKLVEKPEGVFRQAKQGRRNILRPYARYFKKTVVMALVLGKRIRTVDVSRSQRQSASSTLPFSSTAETE